MPFVSFFHRSSPRIPPSHINTFIQCQVPTQYSIVAKIKPILMKSPGVNCHRSCTSLKCARPLSFSRPCASRAVFQWNVLVTAHSVLFQVLCSEVKKGQRRGKKESKHCTVQQISRFHHNTVGILCSLLKSQRVRCVLCFLPVPVPSTTIQTLL